MAVQTKVLGHGDVRSYCDVCHKRLCIDCLDELSPDDDLCCIVCTTGYHSWIPNNYVIKNMRKHYHVGEK